VETTNNKLFHRSLSSAASTCGRLPGGPLHPQPVSFW
jgi:hypothetical protein